MYALVGFPQKGLNAHKAKYLDTLHSGATWHGMVRFASKKRLNATNDHHSPPEVVHSDGELSYLRYLSALSVIDVQDTMLS